MKHWLRKLIGGSKAEQEHRGEPGIPLAEIRRSFDTASADEEHFPSTIDPRIFHVKLILEWFGEKAAGRVLDNGSGKGRFARVLQAQHPGSKIVAFDLSEGMLRYVPEGISTCSGTMTALLFAAESFDCVYATESLEHAVEIDVAVGEMCRVLKRGGRLVIIDKNAEHWGRFQTAEWEKWFRREELEKLLRRDCRTVNSRFISYGDDVEADGLFVAWIAEK